MTAACRHAAVVSAVVLLLTLVGFLRFPGHTFLQSDTQIYIPILEHLWDPGVFGHELLAQHPHVSFTIYDETALALRRLTGMDFQGVLVLEQLLFRFLGILGVYLLGTALQLSTRMALLVAAVFSLGATIAGPAVLTFEYEPVPRGFAIPLLLFAVGLAAQGRDVASGIAASLAFLYHPPSVLPFWIVYFCLTLWPSKPAVMSRRIWGLAPILAGVLALLALSRMQAGVTEAQPFFSRIDPSLERLQRMRASYNWVSMWATAWKTHYVFLWVASLAAFWRVRKSASQDLRFFLAGLPLVGLLSMPVSYLLLEQLRWSLIPQIQPARALLFVTAIAAILAAVAAVKAGERGRFWESALWFLLVFAIPTHTQVLQLVTNLGSPLVRRRALVALALSMLASFAVRAVAGKRRWAGAAWAAAMIVPFFAIPSGGQVRNYPKLETAEVRQLAGWARSSTPTDAVFLFPDAGQDLYPGIFRARSLRAVYVDWKAGGQVNFLKSFARQWWRRWQLAGAGRFIPSQVGSYRAWGIDFFVVKTADRLPGRAPAFENAKYVAYRVE